MDSNNTMSRLGVLGAVLLALGAAACGERRIDEDGVEHAHAEGSLSNVDGSVSAAAGSEAVLVKDINEASARVGLLPGGFTQVGSQLFFGSGVLEVGTVEGGPYRTGSNLWVTDGTLAGTQILVGSNKGVAALADGGDGNLYFTRPGEIGRQIWKSDGTLAGTVMVKEIQPSINPLGDSDPRTFTPAGGIIYFTADDGVHGRELWKTDGTEAGTVLVKDITPGPADGGVASLTAFGDGVLFARQTSAVPVHEELWRSDGTDAGTVLVQDVNPGGTADLTPIIVANGELFFSVIDGTTGATLWKSDGTDAGTVNLGIRALTRPSTGFFSTAGFFTPVGDVLVYIDDGDDVPGSEVWKFDLATEDTEQISPINWVGSGGFLGNFTDVGGVFYFTGDDGTMGFELWRHDFATGETVTVTDFNPASGFPSFGFRDLTDVGGRLFFVGGEPSPDQIWTSDGTAAGTVELTINPDGGAFPSLLTSFNGQLYCQAIGEFGEFGESAPRDLFRTDGTAEGTEEFLRGGELARGSGPQLGRVPLGGGLVVDSTLYFAADDFDFNHDIEVDEDDEGGLAVHNNELWKTDGTECGTVRIADIHPDLGSLPHGFAEAGGILFFIADDGTGFELWSYDPATGSTERRTDPDPLFGTSFPFVPQHRLVPVGGSLYFEAFDAGANRLKKLDVASGDIELVTDVQFSGTELVAIGTTLYFAAIDERGLELWKHDTVSGTTEQVVDLNPAGHSVPQQLIPVGDTLFFVAREDGITPVVYKTDGTEAGTEAIDVRPGENAFVRELFGFDGSLYFQATTAEGDELWRHDIETDVTERITDFQVDGAAAPIPLVGFAGKLFFRAVGADGHALYAYDPAEGSVELILDAEPLDNTARAAFGQVREAAVVGDTLFFTAAGRLAELWMSDGTPEGTVPLPFDDVRGIQGLVDLDGTLVFSATAPDVGQELFKLGGSASCSEDVEAPVVAGVEATPNPVFIGQPTVLSATGDDSLSGGSTIVSASYSVDGGEAVPMDAADGAFDSSLEDVTATLVFEEAGVYEVCVTVTDSEDNISAPECTVVEALAPDTEAPQVSGVEATPNPVFIGEPTVLSATGDDSLSGGSTIVSASYSVDGGEAVPMDAADGAFDSSLEDVTATLVFEEAGVYEVCVTVTDSEDNVSAPECVLLQVVVCADVNGDGRVTRHDLRRMRKLLARRGHGRYAKKYDLNGDGKLTRRDLRLAKKQLGERCERPANPKPEGKHHRKPRHGHKAHGGHGKHRHDHKR